MVASFYLDRLSFLKGIIAACAPTIRPIMRDMIENGIFSGLLSSGNSIISRKSSLCNIQGSPGPVNSHHTSNLKGGADEEMFHLNDMADTNKASVHVDGPKVARNDAIHVL
jgi:hypothetical protein